MDNNWKHKLFEKYPTIFKTPISISCGEGWYWLIDNLCEQIYWHIENKINYESEKLDVTITNIKEKFGILVIFIDGADDTIWNYIKFATNLSTKICEECGSTKYMGKTSGWIRHLCIDCGKKSKNEWTPNEGVMKEIRKDKLLNIEDNKKDILTKVVTIPYKLTP